MTSLRAQRLSWRLVAAGLGLVLAAGWLLSWRVTTQQGVNFEVSAHSVPLYVKAIDFLHRHYQYQQLAAQITAGHVTDAARLRAILDWTRANIRPTPDGWPVIDDHILHIIIRGHGLSDQMADVCTTLATYAGIPAFWRTVGSDTEVPPLVLSFARLDGRWTLMDVAGGVLFAGPDGRPADLAKLLETPALADEASGGRVAPGGISYARYVERLSPFEVPPVLRAQQQMPLQRIRFELQRFFHVR